MISLELTTLLRLQMRAQHNLSGQKLQQHRQTDTRYDVYSLHFSILNLHFSCFSPVLCCQFYKYNLSIKTRDVPDFGSGSGRSGIRPFNGSPAPVRLRSELWPDLAGFGAAILGNWTELNLLKQTCSDKSWMDEYAIRDKNTSMDTIHTYIHTLKNIHTQ